MTDANAPFAGLDESALHQLAPGGAVRSYARNVAVVSEGDATDSLYVVLSGRVKAFVSDAAGKEVIFNTIGAGDHFGELVLDGGARSASRSSCTPISFPISKARRSPRATVRSRRIIANIRARLP